MSRLRSEPATDAGFTLIELLVAMILMSLLGGMITSLLTATRGSARATTAQLDLTGEARTALNRITGDIREAVPLVTTAGVEIPAITAVNNPDGPDYDPTRVTSVTLNLDVTGDGCINGIASANISPATTTPCSSTSPAVDLNQPETETFCWDPQGKQVYLLAVDPSATNEATPTTSCGGGVPLLAGKVTAFKITYQSSLYRYQNLSGVDPKTGITTWYDLDAAGLPIGNGNDTLDTPELTQVDSVFLDMTLGADGHTQTFTSGTELRNVHPDV